MGRQRKEPAMGNRLAVVSKLISFSAAMAAAQAGAPPFQTGSKLVLAPVVVRDRDGHAVDDLRQANFQLFDKGKQQAITSFSVQRAAEKGAMPGRFAGY